MIIIREYARAKGKSVLKSINKRFGQSIIQNSSSTCRKAGPLFLRGDINILGLAAKVFLGAA